MLPTQLFYPGTGSGRAGDLTSDPDSHFIVDANGALADGGTPFSDGDQYYYFVSARDLLGRPGTLSDATLVTVCSRMPPLQPTRVKVTNERSSAAGGETHFQVAWSMNPAAQEAPDHYLVYRWANPAEMIAANNPSEYTSHQVGTSIPHVAGTTRYSILDDGSGSPAIPGDINKTWWYSVRAVMATACGALVSGNSGPGFGVLRDREGPNAGGATITVRRFCPEIVFESFNTVSLTSALDATFSGPTGSVRHVEVNLQRVDPRINGAAVYLCLEDGTGDTPTEYLYFRKQIFYIHRRKPSNQATD